jgi:hypothetical protein
MKGVFGNIYPAEVRNRVRVQGSRAGQDGG